MTYIEDYLEFIVNNHLDSFNKVDQIYFSIYKQTVRGIGLTDRQYALIHKKISEFITINDDIETKIPLRTIDRSKYIKLVDTTEVYGQDTVYESYKQNWKWIEVRFPFSKKDIVKIESLQISSQEYVHRKGSHQHFYKFTPVNVYKIMNAFSNRSFDIEDFFNEYYNKVTAIVTNSFDVKTCLPKDILNFVENLNEVNFADKSLRYNYSINKKNMLESVVEKISYRNETHVCINPKDHNIEEIFFAVNELDRFPLLVTIDEDSSSKQLEQIHKTIQKYVPNHLQSVLFRVDSKDEKNASINDYIKDNNLNNWIDNTTKVVYIKKNKLPKVLLQCDFTPVCTFAKSSTRCNSHVQTYINMFCDCIIYHDNQPSVFGRFKYGNL